MKLENKEYYYDKILNHLNDLQETDIAYCTEDDLLTLTGLDNKFLGKALTYLRKLGYVSYFWVSGMQNGQYSLTNKGEDFITENSFTAILEAEKHKAEQSDAQLRSKRVTDRNRFRITTTLTAIAVLVSFMAYFYPITLKNTENNREQIDSIKANLDLVTLKVDSLSKITKMSNVTTIEKEKIKTDTNNLLKTTSSHISSPVLNKNTKAIAK